MGLFSRRKSKKPTAQTHSGNGFLKSTSTSRDSSRTSTMNGTVEPNIPDIPIPKAPDPNTNPVAYLRSIHAVRERSRLVLEKAKRNQLKHFDVDMKKFGDTASYVVSIIKVPHRAILAFGSVELTLNSGISKMSDTPQFLLMADGSTLTSVDPHVFNSSWTRGRHPLTTKNDVDDCLTFSSSLSFWTLVQAPNGSTRAKRTGEYIEEVKGWLLQAWRCSRVGCSAAIPSNRVKWTVLACVT
jgi:hypothetical protein